MWQSSSRFCACTCIVPLALVMFLIASDAGSSLADELRRNRAATQAVSAQNYYRPFASLKHVTHEKNDDDEEGGGALWSTCLTPDGMLALTAGELRNPDGDGIIWNTVTGGQKAKLNRTKPPELSQDEEELMSRILEVEEEKRDASQRDKLSALERKEREQDYGGINDCSATPDGKYFVTGHSRGKVALWDSKTGSLKLGLDAEGSVDRVVVAHDGMRIAGAGKIGRIWDIPGGNLVAELKGDESINNDSRYVTNILFFDDDKKVATANANALTVIWDAVTGRPLRYLRQPRARRGKKSDAYFAFAEHPAVFGLATTPSGARIVTGGEDGSVAIWNTQTGELLHRTTGHMGRVNRIAMSPSGEWFVTASYDKTARVWNTGTGKPLRELKGHMGELRNVEVVADGRWVVTASFDKTVRIWDVNLGEPLLRTLDHRAGGHTARVYTFASALDGQIIVSVSEDGTGRIWRRQ